MKKISVIVPVYNVDRWLDRCIHSIVNQTYKEQEIILVDDGSTDKSGSLCDRWSKIDSRIRVIHKENGGLSDARNYGIEIATGEYITFIDSDDFIDESYLHYLYDLIIQNNSDLSVCQLFTVNDLGDSIEKKNKSNTAKNVIIIKGKEECMRQFLIDSKIGTVAWRKLYKSGLFKSDIRYPKGKYHEDIWTTYKYIEKCNCIAVGNQQLYAYRIRTGSIMNSVFSPNHLDGVKGSVVRFNELQILYPTLRKEAAQNIIYSANQCMIRLGKIRCLNSEYLDYLKDIYDHYLSLYLRGNSCLKAKLFSIIAKFMPKFLIKTIYLINTHSESNTKDC